MCVQDFSKVRNRQDLIFHLRSEASNLLTSGVSKMDPQYLHYGGTVETIHVSHPFAR